MKDTDSQPGQWNSPPGWIKIHTVDMHTEGEPLRIIVKGYPDIPGKTILERRNYALRNLDQLRTALMWEPRGHADMYGGIITPAVSDQADFGVLFLHNEGYSSMCGHGIIAVTKFAVETKLVAPAGPVTRVGIDTPSGFVTAYARVSDGKVTSVCFHNVPSFVVALDEIIEVPELGTVRYDLAFGGAFYAFVNAADIGLTCVPRDHDLLIEKGMHIKRAIMKTRKIAHPFEPDLSFVYGTIFIDEPVAKDSHSRNVCIFAEGEVDRSPTGTGVSARMAIHHARGEVKPGEKIVIESIIGSKFTGCVVSETQFGPYRAVIPEVEGRAYFTGRHEFSIDPDDPLGSGFILR
jgi:proline racemase